MSDRRDYSRSRVAFRPSSYSTGIQEIQPYTPDWPQGMEYGEVSEYGFVFVPALIPAAIAVGVGWDKGTEALASWWHDVDAQESAVGGTCVDSEGALGPAGELVSCHRLSEVYGVREPGEAIKYQPIDDDPDDSDTDWTPFVLAALAVGGGVAAAAALTRYKKTGKVF